MARTQAAALSATSGVSFLSASRHCTAASAMILSISSWGRSPPIWAFMSSMAWSQAFFQNSSPVSAAGFVGSQGSSPATVVAARTHFAAASAASGATCCMAWRHSASAPAMIFSSSTASAPSPASTLISPIACAQACFHRASPLSAGPSGHIFAMRDSRTVGSVESGCIWSFARSFAYWSALIPAAVRSSARLPGRSASVRVPAATAFWRQLSWAMSSRSLARVASSRGWGLSSRRTAACFSRASQLPLRVSTPVLAFSRSSCMR